MVLGLLKKLADNSRSSSMANALRRARLDIFRTYIQSLPKPVRVLDVGGTEKFWIQGGLVEPELVQIVLLNTAKEPVTLPNFSSVIGDARDLSQFHTEEFDIVFSNSVIEHVGEFECQKKMADEIRRVGKRYFVQTPAKYFPIEPHFLFPFFACFPEYIKIFLVTHFSLGWYPKQNSVADAREFLRWFRLLTRKEMMSLFPDAKIQDERWLGFTKSFVALKE